MASRTYDIELECGCRLSADGGGGCIPCGASISEFKSRVKAQDMVDFMMQGMSDQVQSINVVPFPGDRQ